MLMRYSTLVLTLVMITGCSTMPSSKVSQQAVPANSRQVNFSNPAEVQKSLLTHYGEWKGTPYAYGGLSSKGIDCSGFVYLTYLHRLGMSIPRTTLSQVKTGVEISSRHLQVGDLVFFKTGFRTRHVGIYLGDDRFIHASTSQGVIISFLTNPYWQSHFWQARRMVV